MPIEIKNITKDFGDTRALDHVTLTLGIIKFMAF
jgi:ABC-type sugar transport system ATPase subunit